ISTACATRAFSRGWSRWKLSRFRSPSSVLMNENFADPGKRDSSSMLHLHHRVRPHMARTPLFPLPRITERDLDMSDSVDHLDPGYVQVAGVHRLRVVPFGPPAGVSGPAPQVEFLPAHPLGRFHHQGPVVDQDGRPGDLGQALDGIRQAVPAPRTDI